jgi:hypothetical protein
MNTSTHQDGNNVSYKDILLLYVLFISHSLSHGLMNTSRTRDPLGRGVGASWLVDWLVGK